MTPAKPSKTAGKLPPAKPASDGAAAAAPAAAQPVPSPAGLGLSERRKFIRPLPAPLAVESDGDTDWAAFNALIADNPNSPKAA